MHSRCANKHCNTAYMHSCCANSHGHSDYMRTLQITPDFLHSCCSPVLIRVVSNRPKKMQILCPSLWSNSRTKIEIVKQYLRISRSHYPPGSWFTHLCPGVNTSSNTKEVLPSWCMLLVKTVKRINVEQHNGNNAKVAQKYDY